MVDQYQATTGLISTLARASSGTVHNPYVHTTTQPAALPRGPPKRIGRTIELKVGDAQDPPFADRSFDTVVSARASISGLIES